MLGSCTSDNADNAERNAGVSRVDSILGSGDGASSDVKLNPPHGEPGHKCEIPVGAPLDSEPGSYVEPDLSITPQMSQPMQGSQPDFTMQPIDQPQYDQNLSPAEMLAQGLNPPHGEAGHKCEIPVGAKLNQ